MRSTKRGCERIFTDVASGAQAERQGWSEALTFARSGDVIVVWKLDRLGRSLRHLIEAIHRLESRQMGFRSLQENLDTTTSGGRIIFHVFGALAEFECDLIREHTQAGLTAARARGHRGGHPRVMDERKLALAESLYRDSRHSPREICATLRISKTTLYRYLRDPAQLRKPVR